MNLQNLQINFGTSIIQIVAFLCMVAMCYYYFLPMIYRDIQLREKQEASRLNNIRKSEELLLSSEHKVAVMRELVDKYAERTISLAKQKANKEAEQVIQECNDFVKKEKNRARERCQQMIESAHQNYRDDVYKTSIQIAKDVLDKHMLLSDKETILKELIEKI